MRMSPSTIARDRSCHGSRDRNQIFIRPRGTGSSITRAFHLDRPTRCDAALSIKGLDRLDDLGDVALHADLGPVLHDLAVLADQHGRPDDALQLLAVHDLVAPVSYTH